nr:DUF4277 domain-containing protein [Hippea maritima]
MYPSFCTQTPLFFKDKPLKRLFGRDVDFSWFNDDALGRKQAIMRELKNQNKSFPNQLGKPIQNPTARWVFENFFAIHLLLLNGQE